MTDCTYGLDEGTKKYIHKFDGDNIKIGHEKIYNEDLNCIEQVQDIIQW
jgi:hypothetical protein